MWNMGLPKTLLDALEGGDPKSPALISCGGVQLSRGQLKQQCIVFAQAIRRAGIKTGDAVSIAETNTVSSFVMYRPQHATLHDAPARVLNRHNAAGGIRDCVHWSHASTRCSCPFKSQLHRGE